MTPPRFYLENNYIHGTESMNVEALIDTINQILLKDGSAEASLHDEACILHLASSLLFASRVVV